MHKVAGSQLKKTFGGRICFFGIGGAKVDTQVEYFLKDAKFNYAIGYGLTETSPLLAGSSPKETIPGTVGPILRGVELAIINPDEETGIGEVVARGPNVMKGYYKDSELTKSVFTTEEDSVGAGWFRTGDLGVLHNGMWLELKGRLKNMILSSSGENIYPEFADDKLRVIALCDMSLHFSEPGRVFVDSLEKFRSESFLPSNANEIIDYFYNNTCIQIDGPIKLLDGIIRHGINAGERLKSYLNHCSCHLRQWFQSRWIAVLLP